MTKKHKRMKKNINFSLLSFNQSNSSACFELCYICLNDTILNGAYILTESDTETDPDIH